MTSAIFSRKMRLRKQNISTKKVKVEEKRDKVDVPQYSFLFGFASFFLMHSCMKIFITLAIHMVVHRIHCCQRSGFDGKSRSKSVLVFTYQ